MARTNNLNDFLTDVADSIRVKTGKTGKISAASFDTEIEGITAGEDLSEELNTYDTELSEQENALENIINALQGKAAGGGASKYAPRYISFSAYSGGELDEEISNLDTKNITSMYEMFGACRMLISLNLSDFNTNNVTDMSYMFSTCEKLQNLNLNNFKTSNVTDMRYMFNGCNVLTELDLSSFDTSNVTNMRNMFQNCRALTKLDIRKFDFTKVTTYTNIFLNVPNNCEIIVKDDTAKEWILGERSDFTNIKTVAEL